MPVRQIEPHHDRIVADVRERIASKEWPPGTALPSTRVLLERYSALFGVKSASTVRLAIKTLREDGVLVGHKGVAVYVADPQPPGAK